MPRTICAYSTAPITDQASFDAATQVTGLPLPKMVGSSESFTVTYLDGSTTYYFALQAIDKVGNRSPISNVASATTAAPTYINDLAAGAPGANKIPLTWTAIGDGVVDTEASYDLRYSTDPITDDASFDAATQVTGLPAPQAAGSSESFLIYGFDPNTTYYFAIKAIDVKGRASPLSNVISETTTDPDVVAPHWIGDLKGTPSHTPQAVDLTWTAPADYSANGAGPFTCAGYDLRYSTSPILYDDNDATWDAATPVTGLPTPQAPGNTESVTVVLPTGGTTYYFAVKVSDDASPANVSEVSNCAAATSSTLGDTVLQNGLNGYAGCMDSYIDQSSANYGGSSRMTICGYGDGNYQRGLVQFDLSTIPAGTNVSKATLWLYAYNQAQCKGSTGFYGVYPLTTSWTAGGTNWTNAASGVAWTTPGGDFLPDPDAQAAKQPAASVPTWYSWDVTNRVQQWMAGSSTNYGWMVKCTDESLSNQDQMYQSETSDTLHRPKLVISDLQPRKTCDANDDGSVNVGDLLILATDWGKAVTDRGYEPWTDFNSDGYINVGDLQLLVTHWGE